MSKFPFMQVDAFTDKPLGGNPCAIIFDSQDLDKKKMLAIAREMNLSETAFIRSSDVADFAVRFFTPAEEIPLAGHPTIAATYALVDSGRLQLEADYTSITLELIIGRIDVEIFASGTKIERIVMSQTKPQFLTIYDPADVMPAFGLLPEDVLGDAPIQTVSTGTPQLMIPVPTLDVLRRVQPDIPTYAALRQQSDFFSPHIFCLRGATGAGSTFARHFGLPPDTPEDPFTGSATGGMAAYLWHHGLINESTFVAEQGHWMGRPGRANVEVIGARDSIETVKVGGSAVTVLRGEMSV